MGFRRIRTRLIASPAAGYGAIAGEADGIVTIDNVPSRAEIRLFRREDSAYLARQFSRGDGTYRFKGVVLDVEHDLVARDMFNVWDDVIAARVMPFKPLALSGDAPSCAVGVPYTYSYTASGGEPPYTFALTGSLPAGLSLSTDGVISGTPLSGAAPSSFTVTVTDARSASASFADAMTVLIPKRYWRIAVTAGNGDSNTSVWEIRLKADATGANLAVAGSAFTNSEYPYGGLFAAEKAFDNDTTSRWAADGSNPLPHIIGYVLPTAQVVNTIEIVGEFGSGSAPRDFVVQSSVDGSAWSDEWSVAGQTGWSVKQTRVFNRP